tara:strand:- start:2860 stop:3072 length:213 start_codon:yes stop_codon:yes gene_type:complete
MPSLQTAVDSMITTEDPDSIRFPKCLKCQLDGAPLFPEYWHIGDTIILLLIVLLLFLNLSFFNIILNIPI